MAQDRYRVGVDVGGTFTDLICITPDGQVVLDKTPTTPPDQSVGVLTGVGQLAAGFGIDSAAFCAGLEAFVHGTTTADNTMIEMRGAATGLLATEGHRDEIELRRDHKENIWDPAYPPPVPIARRRARIPIPERCDFEGNVVLALDELAVRRGSSASGNWVWNRSPCAFSSVSSIPTTSGGPASSSSKNSPTYGTFPSPMRCCPGHPSSSARPPP